MNLLHIILLILVTGIGGGIIYDMRGHRNGKLNRTISRILAEESSNDGNHDSPPVITTGNLVGDTSMEKRLKGSKAETTKTHEDSLSETS